MLDKSKYFEQIINLNFKKIIKEIKMKKIGLLIAVEIDSVLNSKFTYIQSGSSHRNFDFYISC